MKFFWINPLRALPVLLLLAAYAGAAWGLAGNVQFVIGDVKLINRAGETKALQKGADINEGDRIVTADGASAQIRMVDGGFIAVRPNTDMGFDTYRYNGKEDGTENAIVSLVQGGFRTITGIIGRTNKQNYMVRTATATIGIRGTDHEPMVILPPGPGKAALAPPGTYDKVNVGIAFIRTDIGTIDIQRNQVGYAPDSKTLPRVLPSIPPFYKPTPAPGPQKAREEAKDEGKKDTAGAAPAGIRNTAVVDPTSSVTTGLAATGPGANIVGAPPVAVAPEIAVTATGALGSTLNTTTQTVTTPGGTTVPVADVPQLPLEPPVVPPTGPIISNPAVAAGNYGFGVNAAIPVAAGVDVAMFGSPTSLSSAPNTNFVLSDNHLVQIKQSPYERFGLTSQTPTAIANADLRFSGGTAADTFSDPNGTYYMGRWSGGQIAVTDLATTNPVAPFADALGSSSVHWIVGLAPGNIAGTSISNVQQLIGTTSYALSAATHPTDGFGNVGTLNSATLTANFSAQTVDSNLNLSFSSTDPVNVSKRNLSLTAAATNMPIQNSGFGGAAIAPLPGLPAIAGANGSVSCTGADCAAGVYVGVLGGQFLASASGGSTSGAVGTGVGLTYGIMAIPTATPSANQSFDDFITGAAVLNSSAAPTVGTAPVPISGNQSISTAYFALGPGGFFQSSINDYQTSPTSFTSPFGAGSPNTVSDSDPLEPTPHSETLTGATVATPPTNATNAAATGVSFGRYTGGTVSGTDFQGNTFSQANQGSYAWIKGPEAFPLPLQGAMIGTATYALDGGTPPGTTTGSTGTLNSAVLAVDFNKSAVGVDLSVTANASTYTATTTSGGALTGNPSPTLRLSGDLSFHGNSFNNASAVPHETLFVSKNGVLASGTTPSFGGMVDGLLTGTGLNGAGMTYAFQDNSVPSPGLGVTGAVAFALNSYTNGSGVTTSGTAAIDPNSVPYVLGLMATGLIADPTANPPNAPASVDDKYLVQIEGGFNAASRLTLNSNGLPTQWDGEVPVTTPPNPICSPTPCPAFVNQTPARFSIDPASFVATGATPGTGQVALPAGKNPATLLEFGRDAITGISWGRYGGGVVAIFDRIGGGFSPKTADLSTQNWHGIFTPTQTGPMVLPTTGTFTYINAGGTSPTNSIGSAPGTLNAATLVADFAAQTVNAGVNLTVNGQTWAAGGTGIPIQQRTFFEAGRGASGGGNLNICTGAACGTTTLPTAALNTANTSGRLVGAFTGPSGQGVGMAYSLNQGGVPGTTVSGVAAFRRP